MGYVFFLQQFCFQVQEKKKSLMRVLLEQFGLRRKRNEEHNRYEIDRGLIDCRPGAGRLRFVALVWPISVIIVPADPVFL